MSGLIHDKNFMRNHKFILASLFNCTFKDMHRISFLAAVSLLLLMSCQPSSNASSTEEEVSYETATDSLAAIPPQTYDVVPELVGKWKIISKKVGDIPLTDTDLGTATITITKENKLIRETPDLDPQLLNFTYAEGMIITEQEGEQQITKLTPDSLILSSSIDGILQTDTYIRIE